MISYQRVRGSHLYGTDSILILSQAVARCYILAMHIVYNKVQLVDVCLVPCTSAEVYTPLSGGHHFDYVS